MVKQGIVLGHIVSEKGIEVDKSKIDLIRHLPSPTSVREVRSFLGHGNSEVKRVARESIPRMGDPSGSSRVSSQKQNREGMSYQALEACFKP